MWLYLCHSGGSSAAKFLFPLWFFWTMIKSLLNLPFHKLMNWACQESQSGYTSNKVPKEEVMSPRLQTCSSRFFFEGSVMLRALRVTRGFPPSMAAPEDGIPVSWHSWLLAIWLSICFYCNMYCLQAPSFTTRPSSCLVTCCFTSSVSMMQT